MCTQWMRPHPGDGKWEGAFSTHMKRGGDLQSASCPCLQDGWPHSACSPRDAGSSGADDHLTRRPVSMSHARGAGQGCLAWPLPASPSPSSCSLSWKHKHRPMPSLAQGHRPHTWQPTVRQTGKCDLCVLPPREHLAPALPHRHTRVSWVSSGGPDPSTEQAPCALGIPALCPGSLLLLCLPHCALLSLRQSFRIHLPVASTYPTPPTAWDTASGLHSAPAPGAGPSGSGPVGGMFLSHSLPFLFPRSWPTRARVPP